jgi:hypothetical protein
MREIRKSGSEGGVGFNPPFLPLSFDNLGNTTESGNATGSTHSNKK